MTKHEELMLMLVIVIGSEEELGARSAARQES
jgi:hypothetical protein